MGDIACLIFRGFRTLIKARPDCICTKALQALGMGIATIILLAQCTIDFSFTKNKLESHDLKSALDVKKPIRIGFILATMNEERYLKDKMYFMDAAKRQGAQAEFASCDGRIELQAAKVEALLSKKINVLVIQPVNGDAARSIVKISKADGVPVISYDRLIRNADLDLYVTQDSFKAGVLQAEAAVKATHGKGNYVILMGEAGHSVAEEITRGNLSVLKNYPEINVVFKTSHPGWSTSLALASVENILTKHRNNIQAIIANNDGMALGAMQALGEQKLIGKVFVAGADADLSALQSIAGNKQSLTILKSVKPLAEAAVASAMDLALNKTPTSDSVIYNGKKDVPVVNTAVIAVHKENIQKEIIDTGLFMKAAIFANGVASSSDP